MSLSKHLSFLSLLLIHSFLHYACLASADEQPRGSQEAAGSSSFGDETSDGDDASDSRSILKIPSSVNPQYGPRCDIFRGVEPFWVPPVTGSHHYWQRTVLPVRTTPALVDLRSYFTVGMYEAAPQVSLFSQASAGAGGESGVHVPKNKVRAPTLEPESWKEARALAQFSDIIHCPDVVIRAMESALLWVLDRVVSSLDLPHEEDQNWLKRPTGLGDTIQLVEECRRIQSSFLSVQQTEEGDLATSISDLLGMIEKVFKEDMVRRVRFWVVAANRPLPHSDEGCGFYTHEQETNAWLLSNKILHKTNVITTSVIDSELVDCQHIQYTSASRPTLQVLFKGNGDKNYKQHFCSYSVTAWLAYAINSMNAAVLPSNAASAGDQLRRMARELQAHPHFNSLPSQLADLVAFGSEE
ncbi:hypothetical protein CSUI_009034 [Cystoisospora suis]|uniref:Transmembrane protein n=1 Tax=Cystoisospora suis TaxID=483139 RepID=A0A2C6KHX5_9APIC|nr:hypothetical protein CSUI_009034 [Cystoisospora suis]